MHLKSKNRIQPFLDARLATLMHLLGEGTDALLVITSQPSTYYLLGSDRATVVAVTSDGLHTDQDACEQIRRFRGSIIVERASMTMAQLSALKIHPRSVAPDDAATMLAQVRLKKDPLEIAALTHAAALTRTAFDEIDLALATGPRTELDLEVLMWQSIRRAEGSVWAYDPHIASGQRSRRVWAGVTNQGVSGALVVDAAAAYRYYKADMARSWFIGDPDSTHHRAHQTISHAKETAEAMLKPGVLARDIATHVNNVLTNEGYPAVPHAVGHGIGLDLHERPYITPSSPDVIDEGAVFMIEPAIYGDQWGVRLEDMYVMTAEGARCLTSQDRPQSAPRHP